MTAILRGSLGGSEIQWGHHYEPPGKHVDLTGIFGKVPVFSKRPKQADRDDSEQVAYDIKKSRKVDRRYERRAKGVEAHRTASRTSAVPFLELAQRIFDSDSSDWDCTDKTVSSSTDGGAPVVLGANYDKMHICGKTMSEKSGNER